MVLKEAYSRSKQNLRVTGSELRTRKTRENPPKKRENLAFQAELLGLSHVPSQDKWAATKLKL